MARPIVTTGIRGIGPLPALVAERAGARAVARLFREHGLPLAVVDAPAARIPLLDMVELFHGAARLAGDEGFGLTVGSQMRAQDFGPWVTAAAAAPSLGAALVKLVRNIAAFQPDSLHLRRVGEVM